MMRYMRKEKEAKLLRMGAVLYDINEGTVKEKIDRTIRKTELFFHRMGLKTRLSECGLGEEAIESVARPFELTGWQLGEHGNIGAKEVREIMRLCL